MNAKLLPLVVLALTGIASAQNVEQVSAERAERAARKVTSALGAPSDAPFAVDPDPAKPAGIKGSGETGLLAVPDRKLTPESVAAAGRDFVPVGHLWMRNVVPAVGDVAADPAKLRTVVIRDNEQEVKVDAYFLGLTKSDGGELTLCIFGKEKDPLIKVPLVKTSASESATPIGLDAHKEGDDSAVAVITLFGSYKADMTVKKPRG